jgi:hypothetical protein
LYQPNKKGTNTIDTQTSVNIVKIQNKRYFHLGTSSLRIMLAVKERNKKTRKRVETRINVAMGNTIGFYINLLDKPQFFLEISHL